MMDFENLSASKAAETLKTNLNDGLSSEEAKRRIEKFGMNIIPEKKPKSFFRKFLAGLSDFMVIILILAAVISFIVSLIGSDPDFTDPIIIIMIVIINALLGVIQENKAEKAIASLKELTPNNSTVIRDGKEKIISSSLIVPGDILIVESGCLVPADCRVVEETSLFADESSLTGESIPCEKTSLPTEKNEGGFSPSIIYSGTTITAGRGKGLVFATGETSATGKIASLINDAESGETPLQKRLHKMGKGLGIAAIIICFIIFIMGITSGGKIFDMFMLSVSLAVAAIPEGLPSVVTIVLAIGVRRMVGSNVVVKKLQSVEALGNATVICSDKTGTLTKNEMTLVSVIGPFGEIKNKNNEYDRLLKIPFLCSFGNNETDSAFKKAAKERSLTNEDFKKVSEIPFDSKNKYSAVTLKGKGGSVQIFKGAPDIILSFCSYYNNGSEIRKLTAEDKKRIEGYVEDFASRGQRLLSAATRTENISSLPSELVLEGIYGFIDPPRDEAKEAVMRAKRAGIRPVMITGDHILTAKAIATELGIYKDGDRVISGGELNSMTDKELKEAAKTATVFARVSPEHKVRIVRAFKLRGHIVAMTGDGVNDAPALKEADIGTAMGKKGTDVAKSASDIVLLDDNFASIVKGIREGRGIFENIRKAVHFLLSSNIGEIFTIFVAFILKLPTPLLPIQLLWINLITDSLPALALGAEKTDDDIMLRRPKSPKEGIITGKLTIRMFSEGILIGILAVASFIFSLKFTSSLNVARTACFLTLCLSQLIHSFNVKTEKSIFRKETFQNKYHLFSFFFCSFLAILIVNLPFLADLFSLCPVSIPLFGFILLLSVIPVIYDEIIKRFA